MRKKWVEKGFEDFIGGTFGNGGQNLYVSRKGRLQRIFRYDFNQDGYADVAFANSQDMGERPDITVVSEPIRKDEFLYLPTQGAYGGLVSDLFGDGNDSLVLAHQNNGTHTDVPAFVYYGSDDGISLRYRIELPASNATDVAAGDFSGRGKKDLVFATEGNLRIFFCKEQGYYETAFKDMELHGKAVFVEARDLDRDGYDDLCVRCADGTVLILWGSEEGLSLDRMTVFDFLASPVRLGAGSTEARLLWNNTWRPCFVELGNTVYLYVVKDNKACFYTGHNKELTLSFSLDIPGSVYALSADCFQRNENDLVLCICNDIEKEEQSYIFKGTKEGINPGEYVTFLAQSLRSVCVGDIDNDGLKELVLCSGNNGITYTVNTPVYKLHKDRRIEKIKEYTVHDCVDVYIADSKNKKQIVFVNHESGRVRGDVDLFVYYNGPDGFDPERRDVLSTWAGVDLICCDFFDRGVHDLFLCNCAENSVSQGIDPGCYLYHGGPDGFKKDRKTVFPTYRAHGCAVGDFRKSGYLDIAVGGFHNPVIKIFKGGENGFDLENPQKIVLDPKLDDSYEPVPPSKDIFSPSDNKARLDTEYCEVRFMLAADLNNDGYLDLCVSQILGDHFMILWGGPDGFSKDNVTYLPVVNSVCAQVADLNKDGWPDLIVGGFMYKSKNWKKDSCVSIFWGGPDGFDKRRCTQLPGHASNSITVADFNNDGILDIFITSYNSGRDRDLDAYLYWGQPGGIYSEKHRKRFFTHSSCGSLALDFNNDGLIDLAVANHKTYGDHKGYSQIWYNSEEGFKEENIVWLPTYGPHGLMAVDAGNIMDRSEEEIYISKVKELDVKSRICSVNWEAELPPLTWVKCRIRCADTKEEIESAPWMGKNGPNSWFESPCEIHDQALSGRYVQYMLVLGAKNGGNSPYVTSVTIEYEALL